MAALIALLLLVLPVQAQDTVGDQQLAELERVRAQVADQVQLAAYDLVDELVVGWLADPVFGAPTNVVLAGVTVPVGLGTGLQALVETHVAAVLGANPSANVQLVHCPTCTAVVVHSGPEGTVVSRGYDNPAVFEELGAVSGKHALFLDIEAEGAWLVLRARITQLTPDLPIVWSRTLSTSTSAAAMLRSPTALKSAEEARQEYLEVLRGRDAFTVPLRLGVRTYAQPDGTGGTAPPPFLWLQTGLEVATTEAHTWTSSILLGYSYIPQAYQGLMVQGRVSRLLTGRTRSLTRPNLYGYVGAAAFSVWGAATAAFANEVLTTDQVIASDEGRDPRNAFGGLHAGLDLRIGHRVGISSFVETLPAFNDSENMGFYLLLGNRSFQSFGTEVTFCF